MRTSLSVGQLAVAFLSLSPAVYAWPKWLPERDSLVVRQDESSKSPAPTPAPSASPSDNQNDENPPSASSTPRGRTTGNLNTGGQTPTGSASGSGSATGSRSTSGAPRRTQYPPDSPPGNIVMVSPAVTMGTQLYKIDVDTATWVWNYTNLPGTPTAIDVLVTNSEASKVWTLTQNMTFSTAGNRFEWDLKQGVPAQTPLLMDEYTLIIHASDRDRDQVAEPGYLSTFSQFRFGLYQKRPYVDNGEGYKCAACSGASSGFKGAVGVAAMTSVLTVATFTWFVVGVGAI